MRVKRKVLNTCPEHIELLADFCFTGKTHISKMKGGARPKDYPYKSEYEIREVSGEETKSQYVVIETGKVLYHSLASKVGKYLAKQSYARGNVDLNREDNIHFEQDTVEYKGSYVSFDNVQKKLEQMAGVKGIVCASIGMGRVQGVFDSQKEAEEMLQTLLSKPQKFKQGHLVFVYHLTKQFVEKYNRMVPDDSKKISLQQRTIYVDLANIVNGQATSYPAAAHNLKDLGFSTNINDDDPFWYEVTLVPLNEPPKPTAESESKINKKSEKTEKEFGSLSLRGR